MEQNIDEIIAAFDQAYDRPRHKSNESVAEPKPTKKTKKSKKRRRSMREEKTERIIFAPSADINANAIAQPIPRSNAEQTHILTSSPQFFSVGSSINIGKRKNQQDSIALSNNDYDNPCTANKVYGVLSDGMGGMQGGEKASAICTKRMMQFFENPDLTDFPLYIEKCLDIIDGEIANLKNEDGAPLGAGATIVAFIIVHDLLYWASVGDSHLYLVKNNEKIQRLNREHNLMLRLMNKVKDGELTIEQAQQNPQKEALISYMGMDGLNLIDYCETPIKLEEGDVVFACSDGMYRLLSDLEMENLIRNGIGDVPLLSNILVNSVLEKQYKFQDNISVILVKKI